MTALTVVQVATVLTFGTSIICPSCLEKFLPSRLVPAVHLTKMMRLKTKRVDSQPSGAPLSTWSEPTTRAAALH